MYLTEEIFLVIFCLVKLEKFKDLKLEIHLKS